MFNKNTFLQHTTNTLGHNKMTRAGVKAPFSLREQSEAPHPPYDRDRHFEEANDAEEAVASERTSNRESTQRRARMNSGNYDEYLKTPEGMNNLLDAIFDRPPAAGSRRGQMQSARAFHDPMTHHAEKTANAIFNDALKTDDEEYPFGSQIKLNPEEHGHHIQRGLEGYIDGVRKNKKLSALYPNPAKHAEQFQGAVQEVLDDMTRPQGNPNV